MSLPTQYAFPDGLAQSIIGGWPDSWKYDDDFNQKAWDAFEAGFEPVKGRALGDPKESWYQGVTFTALIRRRSDGALFGFSYWEPVAKHGEPYYEPNGDNNEYIFYPVKAFHVDGYEVQETKENR